jgi:hypothetical protein
LNPTRTVEELKPPVNGQKGKQGFLYFKEIEKQKEK